jgi:hypothetical protein
MSARRPRPEDLRKVIEIIIGGRSLRAACEQLGLDVSSTHKKIKASDRWRPQYQDARELRADYLLEQGVQICIAAAMKRKVDGIAIDAAGANAALSAIKWAVGRMDPKSEPPTRISVGFEDLAPEEIDRRLEALMGELGDEDREKFAVMLTKAQAPDEQAS